LLSYNDILFKLFHLPLHCEGTISLLLLEAPVAAANENVQND
jgi:hypothetical protein